MHSQRLELSEMLLVARRAQCSAPRDATCAATAKKPVSSREKTTARGRRVLAQKMCRHGSATGSQTTVWQIVHTKSGSSASSAGFTSSMSICSSSLPGALALCRPAPRATSRSGGPLLPTRLPRIRPIASVATTKMRLLQKCDGAGTTGDTMHGSHVVATAQAAAVTALIILKSSNLQTNSVGFVIQQERHSTRCTCSGNKTTNNR